ncbi:MAG: hypothetical protein ACF8OB_03285 [Phycisphaeraceae bacterium JB051]
MQQTPTTRKPADESVAHPTTQKTGINPSAIEQVLEDIHCPNCEYNLRGLLGNEVDCPECGNRCNITELVSMKWTKPWYKAPGFNAMSIPALVAVTTFILITSQAFRMNSAPVTRLLSTVSILVWIGSFYIPYKRFDSMKGVWLALLMHATFLGMMTSLITIAISGLALIGLLYDLLSFQSQFTFEEMIIPFLIFLCCIIFWGCRRSEKYIAKQCIDRYLKKIRTL